MASGEFPQHDLVDQGKNCRVGPNANRDSGNHPETYRWRCL